MAASRTVRGLSAKGVLILSGSQFTHKAFNQKSIRITKCRGLRNLSGLIGIALVLILIFFSSPVCAVQITLAWDTNDESDVAGYIVYYGKQSGYYDYDVDVGDYNSVTISGLVEDVMYYFAVTAYDDEGNESDFSAEITYPRTSTYTVSGTSGGGGDGGGGCFVTAASDFAATSDQNNNMKKFAMIPLVISLLLAALLPRCVPIPRTRQQ